MTVFIGNLAAAALAFALNVTLARLMSKSDFGRINLIFSIVVVLYTIGDFGFSTAVVVFHNSKKSEDPESIGKLNRCFMEFESIIIPVLITSLFFVKKLYKMTYFEIFVTIIALCCFGLYRYGLSVLQAQGEWTKYNILNVGGNFLKILIILIPSLGIVFWGNTYKEALVGYIFQSIGLIVLIVWLFGWRLSTANPDDDTRKFLWRILWPIGVANTCIIITMRFGVFITESVLGSKYVAVFSAANTLSLVFPLLTTSMMNVLVREAATLPGESFIRLLLAKQKHFLPYLIPVVIGAVLAANPLVRLFFGDAYSGAGPLFAMLLIPHIGGIFFSPLESYYYGNHQVFIMKFKAVEMMLMIIFSILLIFKFGLYGVALATIISRVFGWIYLYRKIRLTLKMVGSAVI